MVRPERLTESVTLYDGDCLEVLPTLAKGSVDAVVTDPPYGVSYQSAWRIDKTDRFPVIAGDDAPRIEWITFVKNCLAKSGCLLCFSEWKHGEVFRQALITGGFHVGAQLIWDRVVPGMGDLKGRPSPAHDLIWFAVHGRYQLPGRRPSSVYRHQRLSGCELIHPTQKPESLMAELIRDYTPSGSTILDPFAGSGTTAIAAMKEGRKCILIEKDPHYCEIIRRRVREADGAGSSSLFREVVQRENLFAGAVT